jgi:hypothetical protein
MPDTPPLYRPAPSRAAIFVDFDNVYTGLKMLEPAAAERFATDPGHWIAAIADAADGIEGRSSKRFLIRNCYLNPAIYSKYRSFWTRAGFRVIDCPSLTQQGKSSTDINLVLDAVDVLASASHIDEFFIASADADFTSLVQRFRAADRRTTVIVAGAVAAAYREMADAVIQSYEFVSMLDASTDVQASPGSRSVPTAVPVTMKTSHKSAADAVRSFVKQAPGPVPGAIVAHRATAVEPLLANDWDGYGKFGTWISQLGGGIEYSPTPPPGWVWDSRRFSYTDLPRIAESPAPRIGQQVCRVTDAPELSTEQYRQLFISMEGLTVDSANRNEVAKLVRDACVDAGTPVSRSAVNFVIQGLLSAKAPLAGGASAAALAAAWVRNVETMCRIAGMQLDSNETVALREWASGGLATG